MSTLYYIVTLNGLYLDPHGRFVEDIRNAWVAPNRAAAIKMASNHWAFVTYL